MNWPLSVRVDLSNERIGSRDSDRQMRTAAEILRRLEFRPGVVLADEVGMGKTYVALAVAASVVDATRGQAPVVVMIPPGVRDKWPRDWHFFKDQCLGPGSDIRVTGRTVLRGAAFLKLLDDPDDRRKHIIFLSHGALTRALADAFVQLAIIRRAFLWQRKLGDQRKVFPRWAWSILRDSRLRDPKLVDALLTAHPRDWRRLYKKKTGIDLGDEPIPEPLLEALGTVDLSSLIDLLRELPLRRSSALDARLKLFRVHLKCTLDELWKAYLKKVQIRLPLLILDEAHHLKNPWTRLSSLFANKQAEGDAELLRGPLGGVFDRMLFLTATPFQLGHHELIQVLRRFEGVRWGSGMSRDVYREDLADLETRLNVSQTAALRLDRVWGRLSHEDIPDSDTWWAKPDEAAPAVRRALELVDEVQEKMKAAESALQPWVIRHARPDKDSRRSVRPGSEILAGEPAESGGLRIGGETILPFLLAARAQAVVAAEGHRHSRQTRAYFADGLASSFEAYRETRRQQSVRDFLDDVSGDGTDGLSDEARWYLDQIDRALPRTKQAVYAAHPKIGPTVSRVCSLWEQGEKVVVFCFFRMTGRALRYHISRAIESVILVRGAEKLGLDPANEEAVRKELELFGRRFFDPAAPLTRRAESLIQNLLAEGELAADFLDRGTDLVMRFLRTPSFLVRYVDLSLPDRTEALEKAFDHSDASGQALREKVRRFAQYAGGRVEQERKELFEALDSIQTGSIRVAEPINAVPASGDGSDDRTLALVRLANGGVRQQTRRNLMLAFNTPFFPEVLVASAVMAEGIDLHLDCRHMIHHDLDWNPSVLEQRTGRLDRLGSKAEETHLPIVVFEPYLEATQDEKQFRVVKDRERWFNVVMGERLELDEWALDRVAERVPLPEELARRLAMRLEV